MATLLNLIQNGELVRLDPCLGPNRLEKRVIYALPAVIKWMGEVLPNLESTWEIEESPAEQADALMAEFCEGAPLCYQDRFHVLRPEVGGIWELKTSDLRFFGWFVMQDNFIISDCDQADRIKKLNLYKPYLEQAVRYRESLDLDDPKYIAGKEPNNVVSNFRTA